jgi:Domain of unknown function (DUF4276)
MILLSTVYLAAEDPPSLAVGRKLVSTASPLTVHREENGHGWGTLKKKVKNYQKMAAFGYPVLLITDLDRAQCPQSLRRMWMDTRPHEMFLFRIAVREVEAWLMADRDALAAFLKIKTVRVPDKPEELDDPKRVLLDLARLAPRRLRNGLLPEPRSKAHIGPEYNALLTEYVRSSWDIDTAANRAPSLRKALAATRVLAAKF